MREYGKHALHEYHVSHYVGRLNGARWGCKKKKKKMIDRFHGGHDRTRDIYLMTHGIIGRSFESRHRQNPARFTQKDRNKVSLAWNHSLYSRDAQTLAAGMRVIMIRDVSSAQDLSNQSVRHLGDEFRDLGASPSPFFSFDLFIYPRFSARVVYRHPLERSRQLPREFDDIVIDRNSIAESRPWKMELPAPSGTNPSSYIRQPSR